MKSIVLLFILVLAHEVLSGIPVRCLLVSDQVLLSVEVETLQPCNRKTTCQFACQDGTTQYIDLKNFNNLYKNQYNQYCHSENPTEWKEATVNRILTSKKLGQYNEQVTIKVNSILNVVFTKFAEICHGGQQVTNQDVQYAIGLVKRDQLFAKVRATNHNAPDFVRKLGSKSKINRNLKVRFWNSFHCQRSSHRISSKIQLWIFQIL
jgi:hypothetical protein